MATEKSDVPRERTSETEGDDAILVLDSITTVPAQARDCVVVCGSHGGLLSIEYAMKARVRALIANDAGVGKDDAGIAGLPIGDLAGLPVACVSFESARIGDGRDSYDSGTISVRNLIAGALGVEVGITARLASDILDSSAKSADTSSLLKLSDVTGRASHRTVLQPGPVPIVALDSAALLTPADARSIAIFGSHGGLVNGRAIRGPALAAFFNDGGGGKDGAGYERVKRLDSDALPACTVSHLSARIGDAVDAYESGIISFANSCAGGHGLAVGMSVKDAVEILARRVAP